MPDFQDQIAAIGFFQQPDRRIGIDLDHGSAPGSPPIPTNISTAATRSPSARAACFASVTACFGRRLPRAPSFRPRSDSSARECRGVRPLPARRRAMGRYPRAKPAKGRGREGHRYGQRTIRATCARRRRGRTADICARNTAHHRRAGKSGTRCLRRPAGSGPRHNISRRRRDTG